MEQKNEIENLDDSRDINRELIRKELSSKSFEELQKLKEKLGSKVYNETIFGKSNKKPKTDFKRANKNRPREMSSKKPVHLKHGTIQTKMFTPRDPRFDSLCGSFDAKEFKSNYKFLKDLRKQEKSELENEYNETTDPDRKNKIKLLIQRIDNQIREQEKKEKHDQLAREEKTEIKEKLKKGEKPVFKKKSEKKIEALISKYEELKKNNKLQKHIERRSKKLAQKDRKKFNKIDM